MSTDRLPRVMAVVVAYLPRADALVPLLQGLSAQVEAVLVVDNTPPPDASLTAMLSGIDPIKGIRVVAMGSNRGIAAALNVGIAAALDEGFDYLLLSDQDSLPGEGMVAGLVDTAIALGDAGACVGCVCPRYFDQTSGQHFRFQVEQPGRFFYASIHPDPATRHIEIVTAISSGTLLPREALRVVGGMREDFFIDHVDTEWCHRARALGFRNFGTPRATLTHRLGDDAFRVWWLGWHRYSTYSPLRLYYRFRNFVLMCRLPHVPPRWSLRAGWYWMGAAYAHAVFAPRRPANIRAIMLGLWDGLHGRSGQAVRTF